MKSSLYKCPNGITRRRYPPNTDSVQTVSKDEKRLSGCTEPLFIFLILLVLIRYRSLKQRVTQLPQLFLLPESHPFCVPLHSHPRTAGTQHNRNITDSSSDYLSVALVGLQRASIISPRCHCVDAVDGSGQNEGIGNVYFG